MSSETKRRRVVVIGLWHLGSVNAVGFCEKGYRVTGIETDPARLSRLREGHPPLYEPGLEEALGRHARSGSLQFEGSFEAVAEADWVVIAYDSPVNDRDEVDISPVARAARGAAPHLRHDTPILVTSQVPLGTCERLDAVVHEINPSWRSGIVYVPENLKLGQAIARFLEPDMLVLGSANPQHAQAALELYQPFSTEKLTMDLKSAEMVKHALNTFLATSITFINEIANLSARLGADAVAVGQALRLDKRIGRAALLTPGLGFSGGTLARDVRQLKTFADELGQKAPLLDAIFAVNEGTFDQVVAILQRRLGTLVGRTIGLLGLTYKAGTSTVRRSPALKVIERLTQAGAVSAAYDPQADPDELREAAISVRRVGSVVELAAQADALVLLTEWPEFRDVGGDVAQAMARPLLVDTKNYLDPAKVKAAGFEYEGFGRS
ncbi:MAG: nucleotide sugar dehydrogenase [Polyangiaceae bacterium]|jgi:UDPglucose 6-dehydrogenase